MTTATLSEFVGFVVTGVDTGGQRFKRQYGQDGAQWACGINLWRGSVWGLLPTGERRLIRRVWN